MRVLYFAWLRERIGKSAEELELPQGITTPAGLIAWLLSLIHISEPTRPY